VHSAAGAKDGTYVAGCFAAGAALLGTGQASVGVAGQTLAETALAGAAGTDAAFSHAAGADAAVLLPLALRQEGSAGREQTLGARSRTATAGVVGFQQRLRCVADTRHHELLHFADGARAVSESVDGDAVALQARAQRLAAVQRAVLRRVCWASKDRVARRRASFRRRPHASRLAVDKRRDPQRHHWLGFIFA